MAHSQGLKDLLTVIRQHPGYPDLLKAVKPPDLPRYRRQRGRPDKTLEQLGADYAYISGKQDQNDIWKALLAGSPIPRDGDEPSD